MVAKVTMFEPAAMPSLCLWKGLVTIDMVYMLQVMDQLLLPLFITPGVCGFSCWYCWELEGGSSCHGYHSQPYKNVLGRGGRE